MSDAYIKNVIEAALLAAGRPVPVSELQQMFDEHSRPTTKELRAILDTLAADYEGRGVAIKETANGFRFQVRTEFAQEVSRLWPDRPKKYSRALLETLALIAYRQPITRAEIEHVRGVAVNPEIVKTLMERNWVRVVGHRDVPGHPELLGTTPDFLDYFSLKSIDDLPPLAELKSLSDLNLQLPLPVNGDGQPDAGAAAGEGGANGEAAAAGAAADGAVPVDTAEVAIVNAGADEPAAEAPVASRNDGGLDAAADEDDEEELSAPGSSASGLVAAPPSDEQ
ncbi:MAG TPA: SMC-Scp complex subunit ScpB [Steroidobacteraceae bacterium]|nr:SMC-Scp complex subunit ScpB [Steroidobacteraceae bacterium]